MTRDGIQCPHCDGDTDAEFVYIDFGHSQQVGPRQCLDCGAHEMYPDTPLADLTDAEVWTGWHMGPAGESDFVVKSAKVKQIIKERRAGDVKWQLKKAMEREQERQRLAAIQRAHDEREAFKRRYTEEALF